MRTVLLISLAVFCVTDIAQAKRRTKTVQYGPHARHKIKIQFDRAGEPKPINLHFHGGGFKSGKPGFGNLAKQLRNGGLSLAGATYRFIQDGATKREILEDGARAVQWLRLNADEYNIDPDRISVSGYSAGGLIAAWIALHDDVADLLSEDPVLRESSRVSVCWLYKTQVHPSDLTSWIRYTSWDPTALTSGIVAYVHERLSGSSFALPFEETDFATAAEYDAALAAYQLDARPFYQATPDDPPVAFLETGTDDPFAYLQRIVPNRWRGLLHSPLLMIPLQRRLDELDVDTKWGSKGSVKNFVLNRL